MDLWNQGNKSASGVSNITDHPINKLSFAVETVAKGAEKELLPGIVNMNFREDIFQCGGEVIFKNPVEVGEWHPYEDNQQMKDDQPKTTFTTMRVCNQAYKSIKIDDNLRRLLCSEWTSFQNEFMESCYKNLSELWHTYVLSAMVISASPSNKGRNLGRGRNIDLGVLGKPIDLTPENIVDRLQDLRQVLVQKQCWFEDEMILILPTELDRIFVNSRFAALQEHCCESKSQLLTGEKSSRLFGFRVITSMRVPVGIDPVTKKYTGYILAFWNKAFAFYGNIHQNRVIPVGSGSFGEKFQMGTIFGGKATLPEAIAVLYGTLN